MAEEKLGAILSAMAADQISTPEHRTELRHGLADHFKRDAYLQCNTMGEFVRENLESIRLSAASSPSSTRGPILE